VITCMSTRGGAERTQSSSPVGAKQVSNLRDPVRECNRLLGQLLVGSGLPVGVLTEVFLPGRDQVDLEVPARILAVRAWQRPQP
jgi:hypothetical protein